MGWIRKRLSERSTFNGLALFTAALGVYLGPAQADIIITSIMAVYGVYEGFRNERG
jgi:hypothetical protein